MNNRRVVITGMGVVTPLGNDLETFWGSLKNGVSGIRRIEAFDTTNYETKIAGEVRELAGRAREKKLKPEEYTGATFSISNLGMFGIDEFTAVINPPEAAILAVGRIEPKPVVIEGEVRVRRRMRITMSCDHRVIDGATGAAFLKTLVGTLENPLALVW